MLLVTHDPEAAAIADRQLTMRDGRIQQETLDVNELEPASSGLAASGRRVISPGFD